MVHDLEDFSDNEENIDGNDDDDDDDVGGHIADEQRPNNLNWFFFEITRMLFHEIPFLFTTIYYLSFDNI